MAMANSTRPSKPRKDFPLFPHRNGSWAKKVRQKVWYFGRWDDPEGAEAKWDSEKKYLLKGELPPSRVETRRTTGCSVKQLVNEYIESQAAKLQAGKIVQRTFESNLCVGKLVAETLGLRTPIDDVGPEHFRRLGEVINRRFKTPSGRKGQVTMCRSIFRWAMANGFTDRLIVFGSDFSAPSKREVLKHNNAKAQQHYSAEDCQTLLAAARQPMRAFLLLGLNCGLGNEDIRQLELRHIDGEWLDFPRPKTGEARRSKLWPETLEAIAEARAMRRRRPRKPELANRVFLNGNGNEFGNGSSFNPVSKGFKALARECDLDRPGISFYSMRHSYRTAADAQQDFPAILRTMGHSDSSMSGRYVHEISDERLEAVSDFVRQWLFGGDR